MSLFLLHINGEYRISVVLSSELSVYLKYFMMLKKKFTGKTAAYQTTIVLGSWSKDGGRGTDGRRREEKNNVQE